MLQEPNRIIEDGVMKYKPSTKVTTHASYPTKKKSRFPSIRIFEAPLKNLKKAFKKW